MRTGSTARPVTPYTFILENGKMPVTSPARAVKTGPSCGPFSRRARNSPSNTTNIVSAGESSFMTVSPTLMRLSFDCATNHSKSALGWSKNAGTLRKSATRTSMCACSGVPLMGVSLPASFRSLDLRQILVHELHDDSAFPHTGSNALDGTVAHIAHNKNSGHVGFEQSRVTIERPRRRSLAPAEKVRAGKNETALVAFYHGAQPFRPWLRADKNVQAGGGHLFFLAREGTQNGEAGEP